MRNVAPLLADELRRFADAQSRNYVEALSAREWGILALGFLLTAAVKGALWFAPGSLSTSFAILSALKLKLPRPAMPTLPLDRVVA